LAQYKVFKLFWYPKEAVFRTSVDGTSLAERMGEGRGAYRILVGRPEGRNPLGIPRRGWEDNIKMYLENVGWGHGLDYTVSG
jgi:hypothetical protein